ncbi:MAG: adenine phosphoribosyltransferase [Acidimicrobiales bacterium]|nr:adenine phosphoribosyltransferase [Acidimicrobiales bacterium]HRW38275.1 adenine phosphoribosyltransferase [Aquihabitans sp.]
MALDLTAHIRDIADFPKPGIVFRDITPLLAHPEGLAEVVAQLAEPFRDLGVTKVVGIEARGFILATPVAVELGAGFVPVRKAGKLPSAIHRQEYELEYGTDLLEIHRDAVTADDVVLVLDDVLATGGTAAATVELVGQTGARVAALAFLIELGALGGRAALGDAPVTSLITY